MVEASVGLQAVAKGEPPSRGSGPLVGNPSSQRSRSSHGEALKVAGVEDGLSP